MTSNPQAVPVVAVLRGGPHDGEEVQLDYYHRELYRYVEPSDLRAWDRGDQNIQQSAYRPVTAATGVAGARIVYQYAGPITAQFHTRGRA